MILRFDESGYLNYEKYRSIRLTDEGIKIAKSIRNRHEILAEFLESYELMTKLQIMMQKELIIIYIMKH